MTCFMLPSGEEEGKRSRACSFLSTMVDSEIAHYRKKKNHHHRHQKRKISHKQKAPAGGLQPSYKQNASLLRRGYYGTGGIQTEGRLQKEGSKKAMEPESSSDSSDDAPRTKVVVRRLPPSLSERAFTESIPSHFRGHFNWISFSPGKPSKRRSTSRAYIDFKHPEDVSKFFEEFNGHLFVNEKGTPYRASVEYAPHQEVPKPFPEVDIEEGSISEDPEYLEFLEASSKPIKLLPSAEVQLERKEAEKRSSIAAGANKTVIVTPLMDYVRRRRARSAQGRILFNGSHTQNVCMASKKKTACRGSSPLANSIVSSKRASNISSVTPKCTTTAVKPSVKLTHVSRRLLEANQCKEVSLDAKRKAAFEVVTLERSLAEIVQSDQKLGTSRHTGNCRQIRKDQRLQRADVSRKCKQSSGARSHEKQVWVAKSVSASSAKLYEGT